MSTGTSRTSPQIVSSTNTQNKFVRIINVIYIDIDTLVLEITVTNNCLAVLQNIIVYNEQNSQLLQANIRIISNDNFTYTVTIDFLFPIIDHILNFIIQWDLSAYNGGFLVNFDFENTAIPLRKQLKSIIKKEAKQIEKQQKKILETENENKAKLEIKPAFFQKNIQEIPEPIYANLDVFTYRLKNRKRWKQWRYDNAIIKNNKIDFAIINVNPLTFDI